MDGCVAWAWLAATLCRRNARGSGHGLLCSMHCVRKESDTCTSVYRSRLRVLAFGSAITFGGLRWSRFSAVESDIYLGGLRQSRFSGVESDICES
eukprot:6457683-Amphidinium_carterae.1